MTDDTHPEAMDLADWLEAVGGGPSAKRCAALLREQHARIAELEAQLEAVGAGGVQALSAAPAEVLGWIYEDELPENYPYDAMFPHSKVDTVRMFPVFGPLAASPTPTPTAEQTAITPETEFPVSAQGAAITSESGAVYAELPAPNLPRGGFPDLFTEAQMRDFADRTHALRMEQAAPKAAPGDVLDEALRERDEAEDFINELLDEVLGADRPEWSSAYNRYDAMSDVRERITALHKPAVDKAWGQFQSAMAAPQQEAQEPALFVSAKQLADLADPSHATAGSYLPARKTRAGLFTMALYTAPQPAPAPLSDEALNCLDALAAPKAAPGERLDECFPGESRVAVPQGLISAACFAIRNKRDGGKVLEQLRRYSVGDLSQPLAPQQEAQEPVAHDEDLLEQLYWDFDSQRKKTGEERLAFKGKMRSYASEFRRRSVGQMVFAQSVSDDMMNLADRLGDLPYVDPRAWRHLLVYAPQPAPAPLSDAQIKELIEDGVFLGNCKKIVRAIEHAHGITQKGGSVTAPAVASEPIAYLYDDGSWTPAKTEEGRKLNDWMISAGSPKIGVHLASTAQPTPLTTLAQATQAGNQQEARPCHVFTVRKAGGLTEWEPTTMALALPDGAHALYTLPQPSPHAHADSVTAPMRQGKWTWVPVEPSTAMLVAGNHGRPGDFSALKVWEDMLGALDRSFDYTRPVDPPSTNPPAQAADRMLEDAALLLESQHTWLTNIAAANLVRSLAARARLGEKT